MLGFNTLMAPEPPFKPSAICDNSFSRCAPPPEAAWTRREWADGCKAYRDEWWTGSPLRRGAWGMEVYGAGPSDR